MWLALAAVGQTQQTTTLAGWGKTLHLPQQRAGHPEEVTQQEPLGQAELEAVGRVLAEALVGTLVPVAMVEQQTHLAALPEHLALAAEEAAAEAICKSMTPQHPGRQKFLVVVVAVALGFLELGAVALAAAYTV